MGPKKTIIKNDVPLNFRPFHRSQKRKDVKVGTRKGRNLARGRRNKGGGGGGCKGGGRNKGGREGGGGGVEKKKGFIWNKRFDMVF